MEDLKDKTLVLTQQRYGWEICSPNGLSVRLLRNIMLCTSAHQYLLVYFQSHPNMHMISRVIKLLCLEQRSYLKQADGNKRPMPSVKIFDVVQNLNINLHENTWNIIGITSGILFMSGEVTFFHLNLQKLNHNLHIDLLKSFHHDLL